MSPQREPPPVGRSAVVPAPATMPNVALTNYNIIADTLRASGSAEARAIRAMFNGDKQLMDRFLAVAFSALASGDMDVLINSDPMSVVQAIKDAASLGLEPTGLGGEGALIRYKTRATFQPMWRGYLKRIRNSGKVVDVDCQLVYASDEYAVRLGTDPGIHHIPAIPPTDPDQRAGDWRGDVIECYAWALMPSGKYIIDRMTTAEINEVRRVFSRAGEGGKPTPWDTSWGEMARKTVIRRLSKRLPQEATDLLLRVDAKADEAAAEVKVLADQARADISEVRNMALAAVGGTPRLAAGEAPTANGEPTEPEKQAEGQLTLNGAQEEQQ